MQIEITCKKKDLTRTLRYLKATVKGESVWAMKTVCEITVTDGKATFAVPGSVFSLECKTVGTAKVTVPFLHFFEIVKSDKNPIIEITITEGKLKINIITIAANTCFFEDDHILRTIRLPINYTDADLLRLTKQGYTKEELYFNKLAVKIEKAQQNLKDNIKFVLRTLKQYGVSYTDIETLVKEKLYNSPEID